MPPNKVGKIKRCRHDMTDRPKQRQPDKQTDIKSQRETQRQTDTSAEA